MPNSFLMKLHLFPSSFFSCLLLVFLWFHAASTPNETEVDEQMNNHLKELIKGNLDAFLAYYDPSYEDVRIENPDKNDKQALAEMMQEVLQSDDFKALKERDLRDCLIPEKNGSLALKKRVK